MTGEERRSERMMEEEGLGECFSEAERQREGEAALERN